MGISLKLTPPLIARMRLEPSATLLKREERGVKHTGRSKHGLQLQQGRKNRIQCEVTEQRIGKGNLHRAIDWGEIELVGCKKGIGRLFRDTGLTQHLLTKGDCAGVDVLPVYQPSLGRGIRAEPSRIGPQPMSSTVEEDLRPWRLKRSCIC